MGSDCIGSCKFGLLIGWSLAKRKSMKKNFKITKSEVINQRTDNTHKMMFGSTLLSFGL